MTKPSKQNFHVVLLIMVYKMAVTHKSMDEPQCVSTQMSIVSSSLFFNIVKHGIKDLFFFSNLNMTIFGCGERAKRLDQMKLTLTELCRVFLSNKK